MRAAGLSRLAAPGKAPRARRMRPECGRRNLQLRDLPPSMGSTPRAVLRPPVGKVMVSCGGPGPRLRGTMHKQRKHSEELDRAWGGRRARAEGRCRWHGRGGWGPRGRPWERGLRAQLRGAPSARPLSPSGTPSPVRTGCGGAGSFSVLDAFWRWGQQNGNHWIRCGGGGESGRPLRGGPFGRVDAGLGEFAVIPLPPRSKRLQQALL